MLSAGLSVGSGLYIQGNPMCVLSGLLKGQGAACPRNEGVALQDPQAAPQKDIIPLPYSIVCVCEHVGKNRQ